MVDQDVQVPPASASSQRGSRNENPPEIGIWKLLREDLRTHDGNLFEQGFWAIAVHRFGNWRMGLRAKVLRAPCTVAYLVLYKLVEWTCGISLPYTVKLGRRVRIWHHSGIIISARSIGNDVHLRQNTTLGVAPRSKRRSSHDRRSRGHRLRGLCFGQCDRGSRQRDRRQCRGLAKCAPRIDCGRNSGADRRPFVGADFCG